MKLGRNPVRIGRKRRLVGWMFTSSAVAAALVWLASRWVWVNAAWVDVSASISGGGFHWLPLGEEEVREPELNLGWGSPVWFRYWLGWEDVDGDGHWMPERERGVYNWATAGHDDREKRVRWSVLLWPVALVLSVPGGVLLVSARRSAGRVRSGRCAGCGYDLRGLDAGAVCPECARERVS